MSITKADAYQHALCMDLQKDRFQYAVVSTSTKKIVHSNQIELGEFNREGVQKLLVDEALTYDYGSYIATAASKRNTLVPVDIFNYSKADEIFKLNYSQPIDNLDYNRIPELGIVNIYEFPIWMKSLFVIKFPRVKLVHPATVLLKGMLEKDAWREKVHVYIEDESFYLIITAKDKLSYFNRFDRTNVADLVYHLLFVLEQKEIDAAKAQLLLYGVKSDFEALDKLQECFKEPIKVSAEAEQGEQFILAKQLLCV